MKGHAPEGRSARSSTRATGALQVADHRLCFARPHAGAHLRRYEVRPLVAPILAPPY